MNKWAEILLGLILVIGTILVGWYSAIYNPGWFGRDWNFLHAAWLFFKGGLWWFVLMIGILLILLGISDLKE